MTRSHEHGREFDEKQRNRSETTHQVLYVAEAVGEAGSQHHAPIHNQRCLAMVGVLDLHKVRDHAHPEPVQRHVLKRVLGQTAAALGRAVTGKKLLKCCQEKGRGAHDPRCAGAVHEAINCRKIVEWRRG